LNEEVKFVLVVWVPPDEGVDLAAFGRNVNARAGRLQRAGD
jgi:hypothetical protein